ncbi:hypothetical protein RMATCC62417_04941 [Rhizopus microsporus]|nr:hypothetical protein RMATCC62417_04941 [Rhizopus microsporus]
MSSRCLDTRTSSFIYTPSSSNNQSPQQESNDYYFRSSDAVVVDVENKRRTSSSGDMVRPMKEQPCLKSHSFPLKTHLVSHNSNNNTAVSTTTTTTTTTTAATLPTPTKLGRYKQNKLYRKEKLKEAKNDYEDRIEEYFKQLTVGCQQRDCRNKFCASGRGGILNLQPQAAFIMAIQLASMPESRLCTTTKQSTKKKISLPEKNTTRQQDKHVPKSFLQSLFSSTSFSNLLENNKKGSKRTKASLAPKKHWATDFWELFSYSKKIEQQQEEQDTIDAESSEDDESYYQIDSDRSSLSSNDCFTINSSINNRGMLLDITPISVQLDTATQYLHQYIVARTITEQQMEKWCRSVFQSWEAIGESFLSLTAFTDICSLHRVPLIDLDDLNQFFQLVIYQDNPKAKNPRQLRLMESISDSLETLLDRILLNVGALDEIEALEDIEGDHVRIMVEWCRSLMAVLEWIFCWNKGPVEAFTSHVMLMQKYIQVLSKIARNKRSVLRDMMQNMFSNLDPARMTWMVQDLHQYLSDHFHTGPYKHGSEDTVVMTLKCLELIYQANMKAPSHPIVSPDVFYNLAIAKKLNIKNEYRIWKRVLLHGEGRHLFSREGGSHQRRSRLFMTTSSILLPYPLENEYQFSWFAYPFLLPPSIKRKIVLMDAMSQMSLEYEDACVNHTLVVHAQKLLSEAPSMLKDLETNLRSATCPYLLLEIRRESFVEDTLQQVSRKWSDLKKPLKIKFVEGGEEGMDQGGVQKEFFGVLFEKLISPELGLFCQDESTRLCWIRPVVNPDIRMYELVGVMMGLSIYNGVMMNLQFPRVFWKVLVMPSEALVDALAERQQQLFTLEDLEEGWPTLGQGLRQLLEWQDGDVEDIFCRDYEISYEVFGRGVITQSLMRHPDDPVVPVTNANREAYVKDYCTYFMYTAQREQILALRRGMWSVIGSRALYLCTAEELEMVACGQRQGPDAIELNMSELEAVAEYDEYTADHPTIRQFWSVVHHDLTAEQKRQLLLFVTASDRVPVGGLKELTFYIQRNGPDSDRLLLPEYSCRSKLRDRLITAIENTKGFGLV